MDNDDDTPMVFGDWMQRYPGLVSLLNEAGKHEFKAGMRLIGFPLGSVMVLGRACKVGPEFPVAQIYDGVGGFDFILISGEAQIDMPPLNSEASIVAACAALDEHMAGLGFPAALEDMAPGGRLHSKGFNPLLPAKLKFDVDSITKIVRALVENTREGTSRIAPPVREPDSYYEGLPVFDVRMAAAELAKAMEDVPEGVHTNPMLVRRASVGGLEHYLVVDAIEHGEAYISWIKVEDNRGFVHKVFPKEASMVQPAPPLLAYRAQAGDPVVLN